MVCRLFLSRKKNCTVEPIRAPPSTGHPFLFQFKMKSQLYTILPYNKANLAVINVKRISNLVVHPNVISPNLENINLLVRIVHIICVNMK